jgi:glycosyltransferase involved in cell wall biosynthesis
MKNRPLVIFISHPSHFLTDSEPHGDGLLAFQYIERLARRGHQLHVAVPVMSLRKPTPPNVYLYPLQSFTRTSIVNPSSLNRLEYALRVRRLLGRLRRKLSIDLIHQLNPVVPGMSLFLSGSGLPIVLGPLPPRLAERWDGDAASDEATERRTIAHRLRDAVLQRQMRDAALILIPTSQSMDLIPSDSSLRRKVRILQYGVDTGTFRPDGHFSQPAPSILFLANLVKRKGILQLIDAFEQVAAVDANCMLRIAGSGPDEGEVRERAAKSPAAARIEFLGNVARADVPAVLNACTVYCLPSYGEPFGMTALEAMACGKPVVGSRTGGLGLLLDEVGARRVDPANIQELSSELLAVLASPALRSTMGAHNRHRAEVEFSWDGVIDNLEDLYASVITGGNRAEASLQDKPSLVRATYRQEQ